MEKITCKIFTLLFILSVCSLIYAQPNYPEINKTCGDVTITQATLPSTGTVKALVIYFKFRDDYFDLYPYTNDWDEDQLHNDALPSWAYDVLSPTVQSQYTNPSLSGYFHNMSLGNFELIGDEYPNPSEGKPYISLNDVSFYYAPQLDPNDNCISNPTRHLSYAVYEALTQLDNQIDYSDYDSDHDGYVDLIIMWFRFHNSGCTSFGGFSGIANLLAGNTYFIPGITEIITQDGAVKIRGESGVVVEGTSSRYVNIVAHEIGHLMGFGHDAWQGYYSLMTFEGMGIMNSDERRYLNWINDNQLLTISTTHLNYALQDFETSGNAVKIPIAGTDDYYLLEYRQRTGAGFYSSANWSKWAPGHGYEEGPPIVPDEGLIINRIDPSGFNGIVSQIQCADHRWVFDREFSVFKFPFIKLYPSTQSFDGNCFEMDIFAESAVSNCINRSGDKCNNQWDREYHPYVWGYNGDLWDVGYNQVFSPWSNPKTALSNLSIEIVGKNLNTKTIYLDIRFENPESASPSKPLFLRVVKLPVLGDPENDFCPRLTWYRNEEPNMQNGTYKIYRADMTGNGIFYHIATIPNPSQGQTPTYDDVSLVLYDPDSEQIGVCWNMKTYAYKVEAIDNQNKNSVLSDEDKINGFEDPCAGEEGDNIHNLSGNLPKENNIFNYPNPFNPSTEIKFSLPKDEIVTIKVYNLLGEEVTTLVNHIHKKAGNYSVIFNGTNLSSGLYIYRIEAGSYTQSKKMLLIK